MVSYIILGHAAWGMMLIPLALGTFLASRNNLIKQFLDLPGFAIYSRLTYCVYLLQHLFISALVIDEAQGPPHYSTIWCVLSAYKCYNTIFLPVFRPQLLLHV